MKRRTLLALVVLVAAVGVAFAATNGSETTGTVFVYASDAPHVGIEGGRVLNLTYLGPTGETHANLSNAGILYADGDPNATLIVPATESLDDSQIAIEQIDTTGVIGLETASTQRIVVGGNIDNVTWRAPSSVALDDGVVDFSYGGPSGTSIVEIGGVPANTDIRAVDANTDTILGLATSDGSGRVNFTSLTNSEHQVTLQEAHASKLSNGQPQGALTGEPTQLAVDVNDSDFPADEVKVTFTLDGSTVGSTNLTSNGTASISMPSRGVTGGGHSVSVTAVSHGETATLDYTYSVPSNLSIYNETSPNTLIKSPTEVELTFYAENGSVYTRTTTDGNISFDGLPANQGFVVSASANNYHDRRIYIESLFEQQRIYLLNTSVTSANVVFSLNDETGQFQPSEETTLFIEKPLNVSGSTKYQVITSDQFSATNEMTATLENDQRYRLRLQSPEGQTRVLGAYRTAGDDTAPLNVGSVSFDGTDATNPTFSATLQEIDGQRVLRLQYLDPANATTGLSLEVTDRSDGATIRPNTTESGPFGAYVETIPINSSADEVAFNISYYAERTDYEDEGGTVFAGDLPEIAKETGVAPNILSALSFLVIFATLGLTGISYPRFAGIPTVAVAFGLTTLGAVSIPPLLLSGAGVIALLFAVGGGQ